MRAAAVHLPDIRFSQYCLATYRLNRGVYNAIDMWLYDNGYRSVEERRMLTLAFLDASRRSEPMAEGAKFYTFGKGNLVERLAQFVQEASVPTA